MFINNTQTPIRQFKTKVNLTINPKIYQMFKEATGKRLQPKSWVIENMMKSYILETRLRIDAYRKVASASTEKDIDALEEEMQDRFGPLPDQVTSLLLESKIRCLAENADFDLVETKGKELLLRYAKRGNAGERRFCRNLGHLPKLKALKPLLKLNEIIQYLKIYIHGKNKY